MREMDSRCGKLPGIFGIQAWYGHANTLSRLFVLPLALFIVSGCGGLRPAEVKTEVKTRVIDGFSSPESVIADRDGKRFFVSNVGEKLAPSAKDGDGFISELTPDGVIVDRKFLPKTGVLNSPKGMAIIGQTLFVADVDRVAGFDLSTREQVFELDFSAEKTVFLNDLAALDDKTLFVSATDAGKVYKISLGEKPSFTVIKDGIAGANGLYYDRDSDRLFVVGFGDGAGANGELGVIYLKENQYKKLAGPLGFLDGVAILPDGRVYFTDWVAFDKPGMMRVYDLMTGGLSSVKLSEDVRGPADFYYDPRNNAIWLPKMMEGKVLIERLP